MALHTAVKEKGLWPPLVVNLGTNSFKEGNEATRWKTFFVSESAWAQELVKTLRIDAL